MPQVPYTYLAIVAVLLFCCVVALSATLVRLFRERRLLSHIKFEFDLILNHTGLRILLKDGNNRILRLNEPAARFLGRTVAEVEGKSGYDLFPKYARERHNEDLEVIRSGKPSRGEVKEMGSVDGVKLWGRADKIPYKDPSTGEDRILTVANDISEQVNAAADLRRSAERYNLAVEMSSIGTWDWNISTGELYWSPRLREIVGSPKETFASQFSGFESRLHPDDIERVRAARSAHIRDKIPYSIEYRLRHENGEYVWVRARGQAVWDEAGNPVRMAGSTEDVTERVELEQRLAYLAHHDPLTGLYNRAFFNERLEAALKLTARGETFALLFLDLDGFKSVNDTLGHVAGDELLRNVALRLENCVRHTDTVARLGGDEFALILSSAKTVEQGSALAELIIEAIGSPFTIQNTQMQVGCSIGVAVAPGGGADPQTLMHNADLALYCAKEKGRGRYCCFEPQMKASSVDRQTLGIDLKRAIADDELELHYHPLINLEDNAINGFEAVLLWRHKARGMVPAAEFIAVAEAIGLIGQIGDWVLSNACAEATNWPDDTIVAVAVSPAQFRGGLILLAVAAALARSGLPANRLELDIDGAVFREDSEDVLEVLRQLRNSGVRLSLDGFGAGASSLSDLQQFRFDKIKIDASFIRGLGEGADTVGFVSAIAGIASRLGAATTAKGVDTEEQLQMVRAQGCTEMQGDLSGRPRKADEISQLFVAPDRSSAAAGAVMLRA